ncbi:MAG TPA: hypothetical protein VH415_11680 [Nitrososphaeraceae archaeon]|jgi:hypothetical protein
MINREGKSKKKKQVNTQREKDDIKKKILYNIVIESIKKKPLI